MSDMYFIREESHRIILQYYDIVLHYLQLKEADTKYIIKNEKLKNMYSYQNHFA